MINYLTNTNELTDVADAIREKGGTSAPLTYPTGFVSAIQAISTNGGGGGETHIVTSQGSNLIDLYSGGGFKSQLQCPTGGVFAVLNYSTVTGPDSETITGIEFYSTKTAALYSFVMPDGDVTVP